MTYPPPISDRLMLMITGNMASGKSSVAQALAEQIPRSVHLHGDIFRRMIVNGQVEVGVEPSAEAQRQRQLRYTLAIETDKRYFETGHVLSRLGISPPGRVVQPSLSGTRQNQATYTHLQVITIQMEAAMGRPFG